jgi:hypothetical protein
MEEKVIHEQHRFCEKERIDIENKTRTIFASLQLQRGNDDVAKHRAGVPG